MFSIILSIVNLILLVFILFVILTLKNSFKAGWEVVAEVINEVNGDMVIRSNLLLVSSAYLMKRWQNEFVEAEDYKNAQVCKDYISSVNSILNTK